MHLPCEPNFRASCTPLVLLDGPGPSLKHIGDVYLDQLTDYLARQEQIEPTLLDLAEAFQRCIKLIKVSILNAANRKSPQLTIAIPKNYAIVEIQGAEPCIV